MSGYESDNIRENSFRLEVLTTNRLNAQLSFLPTSDRLMVVNENLIQTHALQLIPVVPLPYNMGGFHILNLPKPELINSPKQGTLWTSELNPVNYILDNQGRLFLSGIFTTPLETLSINIESYIAQYPIDYYPLSPVSPPPP